METVTNPHDKLFRETWSDKEVAVDFLRNYLPEEVLLLVDLNFLEISKDSFVENDLKAYHSDLLYKIMLDGKEGYVYLLFEHKSYPDRLIHLQLLEYMLRIWRLHLRQEKGYHLPVIIPMVLYHGQKKWQYGTKFSVLFSGYSEKLAAYVPDFEFILRDLTQYSDEEIRGIVLYRVVMLLFKHIFDLDIAKKLPGIFALMREVTEAENGLRFLEKILRYLFNTADDITPDELKRMVEESLSQEKGDFTMTIAERLRQEGFEQGIRQGVQQGIRQGVQQGIQQGVQQGIQQGIRDGLIEGIELALSLKFGDDGVKMMPLIQHIQDCERLRAVKNAIRIAKDISELKAVIGN
jgi:predicted transposase/invertase (TIGR01784 family)